MVSSLDVQALYRDLLTETYRLVRSDRQTLGFAGFRNVLRREKCVR